MPEVTDKKYQMEGFLKEKMDCAVTRVKYRKLDAPFIVDGDEGFGKTGISVLCAYYLSQMTGRPFSLDNIFFDPKEFTNFINSTKQQIAIWDEAALGGLASNWASKVQQILIQTMMTCRFRQHIIFFNCPKFYRLNQYFITERPIGLIHVYSEDKINAGRFVFYKKEMLEPMLNMWFTKKKQPYKRYTSKFLRGKFPDAFKKEIGIINEDDYDKKKEEATERILSQYSNDRFNEKLLKLQYNVATKFPLQKKEIASILQVRPATLSDWGKIPQKYPELFMNVS